MKSQINIDNNNILSNPPNKGRRMVTKQKTMAIPTRKNFFEFPSNNLSGEARQNKLNNNKKLLKRQLFLKKIDLKDLSNKYYLEGINPIIKVKQIYYKKVISKNFVSKDK